MIYWGKKFHLRLLYKNYKESDWAEKATVKLVPKSTFYAQDASKLCKSTLSCFVTLTKYCWKSQKIKRIVEHLAQYHNICVKDTIKSQFGKSLLVNQKSEYVEQ